MKIKDSVKNTLSRQGIYVEDYTDKQMTEKDTPIRNWLTGEEVITTKFIADLIIWVYRTSVDYEVGRFNVKTSDFDRVRYFIAEQDSNAYMNCID
jgi:hypothetical protein